MSNKPRKKKPYNPRRTATKLQKGYGKGAKFGAMSYDIDPDGRIITRCDSKKESYKEQCAKSFPRFWEIEITAFMKSQFGEEYEATVTVNTKTECYLYEVAKDLIPSLYKDLMSEENENHLQYWGWYAEAL